MKSKVLHICPNCNFVEFTPKTFKYQAKRLLRTLFIIWIGVASIFGTFGLYNLIQGTYFGNMDALFTIGGAYATLENTIRIFRSNSQLSEISNNLTKDCSNSDDECKARAIGSKLLQFKYESGTRQDPIEIWQSGYFDCDESAILFCSLLREQSIFCMLQCSTTHCWNIIKLKNKKIMADLVNHIWKEF
jgi:hypothetical protein